MWLMFDKDLLVNIPFHVNMLRTRDSVDVLSIENNGNSLKGSKEIKDKKGRKLFKPERFKNQVGGHTKFLWLGSGLICKPMIERELHFYLKRPLSLKPFMPNYEGILTAEELRHSFAQGSTTNSCSYMVLENLTSPFEKPCVLDLKMGTRVHGDFATPEKRESQKLKCAKSTSLSLGVRLCGSLWFNAQERSYQRTSKYEGRRFSAEEFSSALLKFVSDGKKLRHDVVRQLLRELKSLRRTISALDTFRFYSSSLLIVYEGASKTCHSFKPQQRKRKTSSSSENSDSEQISKQTSTPSSFSESDFQASKSNCGQNFPADKSFLAVKMIDFAHTTYQGFLDDPILHSGPDHGYLKGLETLIDILEEAVSKTHHDH